MAKDFPVSVVVRAVDKATAPLKKINDQLGATAKTTARNVKAIFANDAFRNIASTLSGLRDHLFSAGTHFVRMGRDAIKAGDDLGAVSKRVGLTATQYASLAHAAAQADVEQEAFTSSMDQFNKRLGQAKQGLGPFKQFGSVFFNQLKGAKDTNSAFTLAIKAMGKMKTAAERAALADVLFGKSGKQMAELLAKGEKGIAALRKEFVDGAGDQDEFADAMGKLDEQMRKAELPLLKIRAALATALAPAVERVFEAIQKLTGDKSKDLGEWAKRVADAIVKWVDGGGLKRLVDSFSKLATNLGEVVKFLGAGDGLQGSLILLTGILTAPFFASLATLASSFVSLGIALGVPAALLGPIGLALVGIGAAGVQIYRYWQPLKEFFFDFLDSTIKRTQNLLALFARMGIGRSMAYKGINFLAETVQPEVDKQRLQHALPSYATAPSKSEVTIKIPNAPKGTRVTSDSPEVSTDLSYALTGLTNAGAY